MVASHLMEWINSARLAEIFPSDSHYKSETYSHAEVEVYQIHFSSNQWIFTEHLSKIWSTMWYTQEKKDIVIALKYSVVNPRRIA